MDIVQDVNPSQAPSSPADQGVPATSPSATDVQPSPSSSEKPETKESLLSVVQNVVKTSETEDDVLASDPVSQPDTAKDTKVEAKPEPGKDAQTPTPEAEPDLTADEINLLRPKAKKRFEALTRQVKEFQAQLESLRPDVDTYRNLQTFMADNRLSTEDFQLGLGAMAALRRGDLKTFYEVVKPYVDATEQALGITLPQDLSRQVEQGLLPEDTARELTRLRANQAQLSTTVQELETDRTTQEVTARQTAIKSAVSEWEKSIEASDPDYGAKRTAMQEFATAHIARNGPPASPEQALQVIQGVYAKVNETFQSRRPAPQPTRPVPRGGSPATPAAAEPKTLMEAAILGLRRSSGT